MVHYGYNRLFYTLHINSFSSRPIIRNFEFVEESFGAAPCRSRPFGMCAPEDWGVNPLRSGGQPAYIPPVPSQKPERQFKVGDHIR